MSDETTRIRALSREASLAGDDMQVTLCERALSGDAVARAACLAIIANNSRYTISYADGSQSEPHDTYTRAVASIRAEFGANVVIGHSGDLQDGGDRTLFWSDGRTADNDGGEHALGEIRANQQEHQS